MLEGEVEKGCLDRMEIGVQLPSKCGAFLVKSGGVVGERSSRASKQVAWQLIERNHKSKRRARRLAPRGQIPAEGLIRNRAESLTDEIIER